MVELPIKAIPGSSEPDRMIHIFAKYISCTLAPEMFWLSLSKKCFSYHDYYLFFQIPKETTTAASLRCDAVFDQ